MYVLADLKLHVTPLAGPAGSPDLEHGLSLGILNGEPWVDDAHVLFHVADHGPRGTLDLNLLETAETAPRLAAQGALNVDDLQTSR